MLRPRRWFRVSALLWAVLQLALPGALSVIDGAAMKRDGVDVVAHVEATSSKSCQPPHSTDCGLCRYLSVHGLKGSAVDVPRWLSITSSRPNESTPVVVAIRLLGRPPSRAPPLG
jgi:hypothetical protein